MSTKYCHQCKTEYDITEFRKNNQRKDGLNSICKTCQKKKDAQYRSTHSDEIKNRHKKWRDTNPDKIKLWSDKTIDKRKNDPIIKERLKKYQQNYEQSDTRKNYLKINKDKRNKKKKEYYYKNQYERQQYQLNKHRQTRLEVISHYSDGSMKCDKCGENHLEFLEIDHINGGGRKHRRDENINNIYSYLKSHNFPDGYKVLCANCNLEKEIEKSINIMKNGTKQQQYLFKYRQKLKFDVFSHYSINGIIKCSCPNCNETNINKLCLDHIDGGGEKHRKHLGKSARGNRMYNWAKNNNYPSMFRILCANCNKSLGNRGYCPHDNITGDIHPPLFASSVLLPKRGS
jgi:hypothetical protein